jgi:hypothetical protein
MVPRVSFVTRLVRGVDRSPPIPSFNFHQFATFGNERRVSIHPSSLSSLLESLNLGGVILDLEEQAVTCTNLKWLRLDRVLLVGSIKPCLISPNLHTLIWKSHKNRLHDEGYLGEVLGRDGLFGSVDNLHTLELHSFCLKNGDHHIALIPEVILIHEHLRHLRLEDCEIQSNFIDRLLGTQEAAHSLFSELEELSFIRCELGVSFQSLKARLSSIMPQVTLGFVPKGQ